MSGIAARECPSHHVDAPLCTAFATFIDSWRGGVLWQQLEE